MHKISFYCGKEQGNNALCQHSTYRAKETSEDNEGAITFHGSFEEELDVFSNKEAKRSL